MHSTLKLYQKGISDKNQLKSREIFLSIPFEASCDEERDYFCVVKIDRELRN